MTDTNANGTQDRTGFWVLFATITASSMAFIQQFALNTALPALQASPDLQASATELLWVVNAYQLLLGALILFGGTLGDHFGRKRIYVIGILIFAGASLACGLAPSTGFLIAARIVQGTGAALMVPGSLAIIAAYFSGKARGQAIGTWSAFTTMMSIIGPAVGGVLADLGLWRGIFFINLPLAAMALWALLRYVPESKDEEAPAQLDILGALVITLSLAGMVYGATALGDQRVPISQNPTPLLAFVAGLIGIGVFYFVERRSDHPLISLRLFKSRTFTGANLLTLLLYGALGGALFFLPLNLVQVQGYSQTLAALALLPQSIMLVLLSRRMGGFVETRGPRIPLIVGPIIVSISFIALALPDITSGPSAYWTTFFPGLLLFGIGMGIVVAPLTTSVMGSVPQHNAGAASGINNAAARIASPLTLALMGSLALTVFTSSLLGSVSDLSLPDEARTTLQQNAVDLAATQPPESLGEEQAQAVQEAVDWSFVSTFRLLMFVAAGMALISAGLAAIFVEATLEPPDELTQDTGTDRETATA